MGLPYNSELLPEYRVRAHYWEIFTGGFYFGAIFASTVLVIGKSIKMI
jgi:hypothetical protein